MSCAKRFAAFLACCKCAPPPAPVLAPSRASPSRSGLHHCKQGHCTALASSTLHSSRVLQQPPLARPHDDQHILDDDLKNIHSHKPCSQIEAFVRRVRAGRAFARAPFASAAARLSSRRYGGAAPCAPNDSASHALLACADSSLSRARRRSRRPRLNGPPHSCDEQHVRLPRPTKS